MTDRTATDRSTTGAPSETTTPSTTIRRPWPTAGADRVALLVDASAYFGALRSAMLRARRSILIVGWDVDGRTRLSRDGGDPGDGHPLHLRDFIVDLVEHRPELQVHILLWDYTVLYSLDREPMPRMSLGWSTPSRVHFTLDDACPLGASQHQKLVVIDDRVAFCGGFDLGLERWDTPAHRWDEPGRRETTGTVYDPFHDGQMIVDGAAAERLGALARRRWRLATGQHLAAPDGPAAADPWPPEVEPEVGPCAIGIAQTLAAHDDAGELLQIRDLYVAAITEARHTIYIENQYMTAKAVVDALVRRLRAPDPPQVVLVTSRTQLGWLEDATMGMGRIAFMERLRRSGAWDRVRVLAPVLCGAGGVTRDVKVHSKLMVVDDRLVTIGSANLANRSMGLDCELNLVVEAAEGSDDDRPDVRAFCRSVRDRLLAEHLGLEREAFAAAVDAAAAEDPDGALLRVLDAHAEAHDTRRLVRVPPGDPRDVERAMPLISIGDPERPIDVDTLIDDASPLRARPAALRRGLLAAFVLVAVAVALVALWKLTPASEWLDPERVEAVVESVREGPWTPLVVLGGYVVLGLVMFPITVLIAATGVVFGPGLGLVYATAGALASAFATYGVGHLLGKDLLRRHAGRAVNRLSRRLGEHGVMTVVLLRVVPVAPFTVINLVAGASHVRALDFLMGSVVGLLPGIVLMTVFGSSLWGLVRDPSLGDVALVGGLIAAWLVVTLALQRLARRWRRRHPGVAEKPVAEDAS